MAVGSVLLELTGNLLLFCLVFGMSATVNVQHLLEQLKNVKAILTGLFLQFGVLPLIGFTVVKTMNLDHPTGLTLLVVTTSPGGSYSNWWCSMFNADLALSVTMTGISTILSTVMLPVNLLIYARLAYEDDVVSALDWGSLILAIFVVITAIVSGLTLSAKLAAHFGSTKFQVYANRLGNVAGVLLVTFSCVMSNIDQDARLWNRDASFYVGVALPCLIGLIIANIMTAALKLLHPERVTVSIECCYQNVGIATSVALGMFNGEDRAAAIAVPFFYGMMEAVFLLIYCVGAWKIGWTKAPRDVSFWKMILTSYEVLENDERDETERPADGDGDDYYVIDYKDAEAGVKTTELTEK